MATAAKGVKGEPLRGLALRLSVCQLAKKSFPLLLARCCLCHNHHGCEIVNVQMMVMMDDDDIGGGADDGDHDGSKETPPYWTVTFYPTIGNESEGSRRYSKLETESINLNVRKSNLND